MIQRVKIWLKAICSHDIFSFIPSASIDFKIILPLSIIAFLSFTFWPLITDHHELIRNLGLVTAALVGFPMLIWRTKIADRQTKISDNSHLAEVYTKAIEQLGAQDGERPLLEIRLGGVYALERIAKSDQEYRHQIAEVLCAYVRLNSQRSPLEESGSAPEGRKKLRAQHKEVITAIINVLSKLHKLDNTTNLDLKGVDLSGCSLPRVYLSGSNLFRANLSEADLSGCSLQGSNLQGSNLQGANLPGANLSGSNLPGANLSGSNLPEANLSEANLEGAKLASANLSEANLSEANLSEANLPEANLKKANLLKANLSDANLPEANLSEANLSEANLTRALLAGAILDKRKTEN